MVFCLQPSVHLRQEQEPCSTQATFYPWRDPIVVPNTSTPSFSSKILATTVRKGDLSVKSFYLRDKGRMGADPTLQGPGRGVQLSRPLEIVHPYLRSLRHSWTCSGDKSWTQSRDKTSSQTQLSFSGTSIKFLGESLHVCLSVQICLSIQIYRSVGETSSLLKIDQPLEICRIEWGVVPRPRRIASAPIDMFLQMCTYQIPSVTQHIE